MVAQELIVAREIDSAKQYCETAEAADTKIMDTDEDISSHGSDEMKDRQGSVSEFQHEKCEKKPKSNFSSLAHLVPNIETKFHKKLSEKLRHYPIVLRVSKIVLFEALFLVVLLVICAFCGLVFSQTIDSFNPRNNLAIGREGPGLAFRPRPAEVKSTLIEFIHGGAGDWWGYYL